MIHIVFTTTAFSDTHINFAELKVGDKAPDFSITDPNGKTINFNSLHGKVIMLDFWASWCQPCRMANIEIVPLYHKYNSLGFEIFSVSLDSKKDLWTSAIKNDKLDWSYHGSDLKGWDNHVAKLYGVEALPATFLIDENGIIIDKDFDEYDLETKLHKIFFEQINFYPVQTSSKVFFTNEARFEIEDIMGKTLLKGKAMEVDVSTLPTGDYVIKYDGKSSKFTKKKSNDVPATFYPLRADDKLTVSRQTEYEIYNQRGKLEKRGTDASIDVSQLKPGLYHISLDGHMSSFHKK
jgi:peroxiredoxin